MGMNLRGRWKAFVKTVELRSTDSRGRLSLHGIC